MRKTASSRTGTRVVKDEDEWREELSPEQYAVLRQGATEPPGSGRYVHPAASGRYACAGCGAVLFSADAQYDSGSGWPSFSAPEDPEAVQHVRDIGLLGVRTEVRCASCAGHLGHVFRDGPPPTGARYCMNSAALRLEP